MARLTDPAFNMDKFIRRVVGIDPSITFGAEAKDGEYHRERQRSIHADYDEKGDLISNPFDITEEQTVRSVEMARWGAELQRFWQTSWERRLQEESPNEVYEGLKDFVCCVGGSAGERPVDSTARVKNG